MLRDEIFIIHLFTHLAPKIPAARIQDMTQQKNPADNDIWKSYNEKLSPI